MLLSWAAACLDLPGEKKHLKGTPDILTGTSLSAIGLRRAGIDVTLFEAAVKDIFLI